MADDTQKFSTKPMNTANPYSYDSIRKDIDKTRSETVFYSNSDGISTISPDVEQTVQQTIGQMQQVLSTQAADIFQTKQLAKANSELIGGYDERLENVEEHALNSPIIGEFDGSWSNTENVKDVEERLYDVENKVEELDKAYGGIAKLNDLKQATIDANKALEDVTKATDELNENLDDVLQITDEVREARVDTVGNTHTTLQGRLIEDFRRINDLIDDTTYQDKEGYLIHETNTTLGGYTKDLTLIGSTYENLIEGNTRDEEEMPFGGDIQGKELTINDTVQSGTIKVGTIKGQTYDNILDGNTQGELTVPYSPDRSTTYTIANSEPGQTIMVKSAEGASFRNILDEEPNVIATNKDNPNYTDVRLPVTPARGLQSQYNNIEEGTAHLATIEGHTFKNYAQGTSQSNTLTNYVPDSGEVATLMQPEESSVIVESIQGRTIENLALGEMYAEHDISISSDNAVDNLVIDEEDTDVFVDSIQGKTVQNILTGFDTSPILTGDNYIVKHSENSQGIQERTGDYQHMVLKGNTLKNVGTGRGETPIVHHNSCNTANGGTEYIGLVRDNCDVHEFSINGQTVQNLFDEVGETVLLSTDKPITLMERKLNTDREYLTNLWNYSPSELASWTWNVNDNTGVAKYGNGMQPYATLEAGKTYTFIYVNAPSHFDGMYLTGTFVDGTVNRGADKFVFTVKDDYQPIKENSPGNFYLYSTQGFTATELQNIQIMILEGDHTAENLPFFEDTLGKVIIKDKAPINHGYLYGRTITNLKSGNPSLSGIPATYANKKTDSSSESATITTNSTLNAYGQVSVTGLNPNTTYMTKAQYTNSKGVTINGITMKSESGVIIPITSVVKFSGTDNRYKFTTDSTVTPDSTYIIQFNVSNTAMSYISGDKIGFAKPMIIQYQDGMEDWSLNYSEGQVSVVNPTIETTNADGTESTKLLIKNQDGSDLVLRSLPNGLMDQLNITTGTLVRSVSNDCVTALETPVISKVIIRRDGNNVLNGKVKLPDGTCDTYNIETLDYTHTLREVTYSGISSEEWSVGTGQNLTNTTGFSIAVSTDLVKPGDASTTAIMLQDSFLTLKPSNQVWKTDEEGICVNSSGNLIVRINKLRFAKTNDLLADFKLWLTANPIKVTMKLSTPTVDSQQLYSDVVSKLEVDSLLAYTNGNIKIGSDTSVRPRLDYTLPSLNSYSMRRFTPGNTYTLVCPDSGNTICGTSVYGKGEFIIPSDTLPNDCLVLGLPQERLMCFDKDYGYTYGDYIDSELHVNGDSKEIITIKSVGKNLAGLAGFSVNPKNGKNLSGFIPYIPGENGFMYFRTKAGAIWNGIMYYDANKNQLGSQTNQGMEWDFQFTNTYKITGKEKYVRIESSADPSDMILLLTPDKTITESYKESVTQVVLDKPLRRVNDQYKDTLTFKDGKLVHTQNVGRIFAAKDKFNARGDSVGGWVANDNYIALYKDGYISSDSFLKPKTNSGQSLVNDYGYTSINSGTYINNAIYGFRCSGKSLPYIVISKQLSGNILTLGGYSLTQKAIDAYFQDYPNIEILYPLANPIVTEYDLSKNVKQYANGHIIVEGLNYDTSVDAIYNSAKCHKISHLTPGEYTIMYNSNTTKFDLTQADIDNGYKQTDSEFTDPVILQGDHRGKYVPYFNGLLSCEAPIVKSVGKNLFSGRIEDFETVSNFSYVSNYLVHPLNKPTQITIYLKSNDNLLTTDFGRYMGPINLYNYFNNVNWYPLTSTNSIVTLQINKMPVIVKNSSSLSEDLSKVNIMACFGTDTSYAPYVESKLTLPETVILRSLPDGTCDEYDVKTRTYTQRIGYAKLDGSEDWHSWWDKTAPGYFAMGLCYAKIDTRIADLHIENNSRKWCISNYFISRTNRLYSRINLCSYYIALTGIQTKYLWANVPANNLNEAKAYLSKNPIQFQYKLAEPIVTVLEDETIPTVLKCYEEGSLIFNSAKSLSLHPKVEYKVPSYNYFDTPLLQNTTYRLKGGNNGNVVTTIGVNNVVQTVNNVPLSISNKSDNIVKVESTGKVRNLQLTPTTSEVNRGIQGIRSIGDEGYLDITVHGTNYLDVNKAVAYYDYVDPTCTSEFSVKNGRLEIKRTYGVDYGVKFTPQYRTINNSQYTLTFVVQTGNGKLRQLVNGIPYEAEITEGNTYTRTVNDDTDIVFLNTVNQSSLVISNIMLNEGTNAIAYEPYVEDVLRVPLVNGPLNSINSDIYDEIEIDPDRMEATIIRRTKKYMFNGTEEWGISEISSGIYRFTKDSSILNSDNIANSVNSRHDTHMCNKIQGFASYSGSDLGQYISNIIMVKIKANSIDDAKRLVFGGEGLIFICKLINPEYETVKLTKPNDKLYTDGHVIASSDGITPLLEITTK